MDDQRQLNTEDFVDQRLAALAPPEGWRPNQTRALVQLQERDRRHRLARKRWMWITAAASVACLGILAAPASCEAASAPTCRRPFAAQLWSALFPPPRLAPAAAAALPLPHFREAGSITAPITCEIYSDYQCPACAAFFLDTMPQLTADYIQTGKMRVLHRDFPLSIHPYARLAARYANAAGQLGQYDLVVNQLFKTQRAWAQNGEIETQIMQVLPPARLQQVRDLVSRDRDDSVSADVMQARVDQIRQTPSLIIVIDAKRTLVAPIPAYPLLKRYLDSLLPH